MAARLEIPVARCMLATESQAVSIEERVEKRVQNLRASAIFTPGRFVKNFIRWKKKLKNRVLA